MKEYLGEIIALGVAFSWTITALCFEYAGKRMGTLSLNIIRLAMAILMLGVMLFVYTGHIVPIDAGSDAWKWLALSGFIGYVFGDYCLFSSYILIGSKFGQLFMTLAPPAAAITGWFILGEKMSLMAILGMLVTMIGIGISIMGRGGEKTHIKLQLPLKGVLFGIGAGVGQGVGLVFSKLGMEYFIQSPGAADMPDFLIPFASTQIRSLVGLAGFLIIMLSTRKGKGLILSLRQSKAMYSATLGTIFGPFLGVSFSLMAVRYTQAGIASTLMAITPILILLPAYLFFRQRVSFKEIVGACISVFGVALFFI